MWCHSQDSIATGDGNGARWVLENARQLWAGSAADAAARQQRHLALGQLFLAQAHSYTAATAAADVQVTCLAPCVKIGRHSSVTACSHHHA